MKRTISESEFHDWFQSSGSYKTNFSYEGQTALFEYLEDYEESTGEEIDFDPIALCCEYTEYANIKDFRDEYSDDYEDIEAIENDTQVIMIDNESFIIQSF